MKVDIWIPIYVNDYIADTMDLTAEEHGIYFLLILHYWKKGSLPVNINKLIIISKTNEIDLLTGILSEYFTEKDGKYYNKRIDEELKKASSRRDSAVLNGRKGGRPRNPQKTHRLSEGKPTVNPNDNPHKSSSSSSSSSSSTPSSVKKNSRFTPPSLDEIEKHCKEKGYNVNAEKFYYHYESNGWKVGKNKMKSWTMALGKWNTESKPAEVKTELKNKTAEERYNELARSAGYDTI